MWELGKGKSLCIPWEERNTQQAIATRLQLDCNTSLHILIPPLDRCSWLRQRKRNLWDNNARGTTMEDSNQLHLAQQRGHQESDRGNLWDVFSSPLVQPCWLTGARAASPKTKTDHYAKVALTPDREICSLWWWCWEIALEWRCGEIVWWVRER